MHMVCCSFSCQGSYAHTVSHTTGKSLLNQAGLFRFSKSCAINSVCSISDTVPGCVTVFFEAESNNQSVHFHRDIFCRLRVSGMPDHTLPADNSCDHPPLHSLLPSLFFFVIVLGVALGDFLCCFLRSVFLSVCGRMVVLSITGASG